MKPLHVYAKYSVFALASQIFMWFVFTAGDWAFDEHHLVQNDVIVSIMGYVTLAVIAFVPVVVYFLLRQKHFSTENKIADSLLHIVIWSANAFIITIPCWNLLGQNKWIVAQDYNHGGFIDLNGIEYLLIPIAQSFVAAAMALFALLPAIIKAIKNHAHSVR